DRCREIAILVVAAHWRSDFEGYAHEAVGRAAGLGDGELAALRDGRHAELAGRESVVARTAAALVLRGDLDDDEYGEGVAGAGPAAGTDRAEEVLPHRRQLRRSPRGAAGRRLVAPGAQGDRVLPERRRDHRPG